MSSTKRNWFLLAATVLGAFTLLGFFGRQVYRQKPPIPDRVVAADGTVLMTRDSILDGQQVWQSTGGQQMGSVWGHGAYQAPDWSADWLHREALALLDGWAQAERGTPYDGLDPEAQAGLRARLRHELRTNTYDPATGTLTVSADRALAIRKTAAHYAGLYGGDPALGGLREDYAMQDVAVRDPARLAALTDFFFWTSWACATDRPGSNITYTNNWPHEPLIDNRPTGANMLWTMVSVVLLLAGIGAVVWWRAFRREPDEAVPPPAEDPLGRIALTPSMRAIAKYLGVVIGLFGVQVILGALTAHYTVEGQSFFGLPLGKWLPYALTRTWHIQTAVFWIATAFLATGLFLAPAVGGREPRFQRLGVNVLFGALLVVVVGSLAGEFFSIHQKLGLNLGFWFGQQGYEYVDLGRAWQIALFVGLLLWLGLMLRGLWPALRRRDENRTLVFMFTGASIAIGLMYAAGFFYRRPHPPLGHGVLALVGGASLGRGLLRGVRHRRSGLRLRPHGAGEPQARRLGGGRLQRPLPGGRHPGDLPSPLLERHPDLDHGRRRHLQRPGGGPPGPDRAGGLPHLPDAARGLLDAPLPLAAPLLRGRGVLEPRGGGALRVHDQPAHGPLLHAGAEYHAGPRPHRPLRGVRAPGPRVHPDRGPGAHPPAPVEARDPGLRLLGHERRAWP